MTVLSCLQLLPLHDTPGYWEKAKLYRHISKIIKYNRWMKIAHLIPEHDLRTNDHQYQSTFQNVAWPNTCMCSRLVLVKI